MKLEMGGRAASYLKCQTPVKPLSPNTLGEGDRLRKGAYAPPDPIVYGGKKFSGVGAALESG